MDGSDRPGSQRELSEGGLEDAGPVLLFANVPFASPWQRCQQLARCLARTTDVVYVDPNHSFLQRWRRGRVPPASDDGLPPRLRLFRPDAGWPLARSCGLLSRRNYARTARSLRVFLADHGLGAPAVAVMTYPDQVECLGELGDVPVVYDLMDEPALFLRCWQRRRYRRLHRRLLRRAGVVVVSSRVLLRRYGPRARQAVCVGNGVSAELFRDLPGAEADPALGRLPRPRFGYVGMISHWFDFDAVRALAAGFPHGSVILTGPVEGKLPRLPANVVCTGPVAHTLLAPVLGAFDVGLIPFRRGRALDAVNPVKLFEYLAAGLPVLASQSEELSHFRAYVATYAGPADCAAAARRLLAQPGGEGQRRARREFAGRHCWPALADQFRGALGRARAAA